MWRLRVRGMEGEGEVSLSSQSLMAPLLTNGCVEVVAIGCFANGHHESSQTVGGGEGGEELSKVFQVLVGHSGQEAVVTNDNTITMTTVHVSHCASWGMVAASWLADWVVREARAFRLSYSCSE